MPGGALYSVVRTLLALLGVCALAWVVLAALARRGIGVVGGVQRGARVEVLQRVALAGRSRLYLVRADGRVFLLGAGDGGAPSLIAELAPETESVL